MRLDRLQVLHFEAATLPLGADGQARAREAGAAWVIATCQRTVLVGVGDDLRKRVAARLPLAFRAQGHAGDEAYAFLLRFACGLESRLIGETEIFGQVKESWREFSATDTDLSRELAPLVQQLFQDTKEIRAHQLSGLGSASYGSQVRRLLGGTAGGTTLLVGAGLLAQPQVDRPPTGNRPPQGGPAEHLGDRQRWLHRQSLAPFCSTSTSVEECRKIPVDISNVCLLSYLI